MELKDTNVLITGANGNLGRAVVGSLRRAGRHRHRPGPAASGAGGIASAVGSDVVAVDLLDAAQVDTVGRIVAERGRIDVPVTLLAALLWGRRCMTPRTRSGLTCTTPMCASC